jgi:hypothetical protein
VVTAAVPRAVTSARSARSAVTTSRGS